MRVGTNVGAVAARLAGERLFGMEQNSSRNAAELAAALGAKRASIATTATAERLSGSVVGAISPLGLRRGIPTVVDISSLGQPQVYVSAGRRGLELGLAPEDLIATTQAIVAEVTENALAT